jgi:Protein O-mannosyl-transferase TMEM260-like
MSDRSRHLLSPPRSALFVGLATLVVYLLTLAPSLSFIDSGELAAVAARLGVAHPTGYPLFSITGFIVTRLPIGSEEIVRLNAMAALLCAGAAALFAVALRIVLNAVGQRHSKGTADIAKDPAIHAAAAVGAALILGFTETFWSQATSVEVYSLHLFLLSAVMLTFVRAAYGPSEEEHARTRWWLACAFLLGLAFTNHMTTVLLVPGLVFWFIAAHGGWRESRKDFVRCLPAFLFGLTPYLYLPLRAAQNPVPNWGYAATLERFLWHVSGKQYRVWIFSSPEVAWRQLRYFAESAPGEFGYLGLLLAALGLGVLYRMERRALWSTVILFVTCVLYAVNYDIHDIDSYFLLAYWCIAFWAAFGLAAIGSWAVRRGGRASGRLPLVLLAPAILLLFLNFKGLDQSKEYGVEDYTRSMFSSLEPDAVVLSYQWDYWVSASYYYQLVRGERADVAVIDKELLRRSWYIRELRHRYPGLMEACRAETDAFLAELDKFEHDRPYNAVVIQGRFERMIGALLAKSMLHRPAYVTGEIEPEFTKGLQRVPAGLAFRLFADTLYHETPPPVFGFREIRKTSKMDDFLKKLYADAALAWGEYRYARLHSMADLEKAAKLSISYDSTHPGARELTRRLGR